ncbi:MAG: A/G-specific adenine glycosylase [Deltaproteobacteria bacterium]|nr:A/G-specific adenine glycosylase [Deltaproteobacteria bacterium]
MKRFHSQLLKWYRANRREMPWRNTSDPFAIWVSEVMLQQTQVNTAIPYFNRFITAFPTPAALAEASEDDVLKLWEGLGYYARARNLQRAARQVVQLFNGQVPSDKASFQSLTGVGPYISAAVMSIAFGRPAAAVDGNVKRVLSRVTMNDAPVNAASSHAVYQPIADRYFNPNAPGDHNQAMMELGANVCQPKTPRCSQCPVRQMCTAYKQDAVVQYPKVEQRKKVPTRHIAVGVIQKGNQLLICKRKPDGLLGGLWEFPGGGVEKDESAEAACVRECKEEVNLTVRVTGKLTTVRHAYSHFKIVMDVFMCAVQNGRVRLRGPVACQWVRPAELGRFAFPGANHKFIPLLLQALELQSQLKSEKQ